MARDRRSRGRKSSRSCIGSIATSTATVRRSGHGRPIPRQRPGVDPAGRAAHPRPARSEFQEVAHGVSGPGAP
jgi:hypothetical protein